MKQLARIGPPAAAVAVAAGLLAGQGHAAARDGKPPKIVSAAMRDADGDSHADRVRLRYSERVRHAADRDGKYPFSVAGNEVRSVGRAGGKSIVLRLAEKPTADSAARPAIRNTRSRSKPVRDRAGNRAVAQRFTRTRAYGKGGPGTPPPPPPATDRDGDGVVDARDCAPGDAAIKPGAPDAPDLKFVDSNCDGIDGNAKKAIFASPDGKDASSGTRSAPMRQIDAAVAAAAAAGKDVYAAAGTYGRVEAATGVSIYGGYRAEDWSRGLRSVTSIVGEPEGVLTAGATGVVLQHLTVRGNPSRASASAYGMRLLNGSKVTLQRVAVTAGDGDAGDAGAAGAGGAKGGDGGQGRIGACDFDERSTSAAGAARAPPVARAAPAARAARPAGRVRKAQTVRSRRPEATAATAAATRDSEAPTAAAERTARRGRTAPAGRARWPERRRRGPATRAQPAAAARRAMAAAGAAAGAGREGRSSSTAPATAAAVAVAVAKPVAAAHPASPAAARSASTSTTPP